MIEEIAKGGFIVEVVSWENDADSYATNIIGGLTEKEAEFVVAYANQFRSRHGYKTSPENIGNAYISDTNTDEIVLKIAEQIGITGARVLELAETVENDLVGVWLDGERWRVTESVKVYRTPSASFVEVEFVDGKAIYTNELN